MSRYALVLGAKSDIGRAIAHKFAQNGWNLYLAGRNKEVLEADVSDIKLRFKVEAKALEFDALAYDSHETFYTQMDPAPECVISVVGYLGDQKTAQTDRDMAFRIMETNYTGCASILEIAANEMEAKKRGGIIGISSVAGDRGRQSNYLYGSSKAGFSAYLSGLRNRLSKANVHVLTVKPGFVYTAMTEGLKLPAPLTAKPEEVANDVYKAFRKKKNVLYTKWFWKYIMMIITNIPEFIFKKLSL